MLVGVVSDTHDNARYVEAAIETFETAGVDAVIHCGDVVAPFSATPFDPDAVDGSDADWEFHAVRGNNDGEWALADVVETFGTYHGEFAELTLGGTEFAVYHGTSEPIVDALLASGSYDYVCRGHTHERVHEERDETTHLNPGGVPIPGREEEPAAMLVDTASGDVTVHNLG
ncbi:metallophosphoesterase [Halobaculum rubrum]|uniref:metallophosphoesterase n=1 Tax=Halobaculum rubrum TaxID=2872158 RepID=UPI001CA41DA1|nr:metallophosphoesterase [Halobaculum rubrum]QZY00144.1 metallophosphoesterase [Halobaculum rubrum]